MPLAFNLNNPNTLPGAVFVATTGTAEVFSAALALAYVGLGLSNPATLPGAVGKKLVPLRAAFSGVGTSSAAPVWGFIKPIGTCTAGAFSGVAGIVVTPGVFGTATNYVATVIGTCSFLNGTTGAVANGPNWVEILGVTASGTGSAAAGPASIDLSGFVTVMPGESLFISPGVSMVGQATISWLEVPLNSGS